MLSVRDVLECAVRPALSALGAPWSSEAAERLVLGTAAVESGFRRLRQNRGPALSLWQIEPVTYRDLVGRFLVDVKPELRPRVLSIASRGAVEFPLPDELTWNLRLAAALCRVKYMTDRHPLPAAHDVRGMAETWKRVYNTAAGAGKPERFLQAWATFVQPVLGA